MDGPIIDYVKIRYDSLIHGGILDPVLAQKMFFGLIVYEFFLGPGT